MSVAGNRYKSTEVSVPGRGNGMNQSATVRGTYKESTVVESMDSGIRMHEDNPSSATYMTWANYLSSLFQFPYA